MDSWSGHAGIFGYIPENRAEAAVVHSIGVGNEVTHLDSAVTCVTSSGDGTATMAVRTEPLSDIGQTGGKKNGTATMAL